MTTPLSTVLPSKTDTERFYEWALSIAPGLDEPTIQALLSERWSTWHVGGLSAESDQTAITRNTIPWHSYEKPERRLICYVSNPEVAAALCKAHNAEKARQDERRHMREAAITRRLVLDPYPITISPSEIAEAAQLLKAADDKALEFEPDEREPIQAYRIALWYWLGQQVEDMLKDVVELTGNSYSWDGRLRDAAREWRDAQNHPAILCARCGGEVVPDRPEGDGMRCGKCLSIPAAASASEPGEES